MTMPLRSRRFTLCADDFGQSHAISDAILELIRLARISATSVMSQGPAWPDRAPELKELQHLADVGVHLNLTHRFAGHDGSRPLPWWLFAAPRGLINRAQTRSSFLTQIDLFTQHFGRLPDYLDGHQHVHAFPVIREVLTEVIADCWRGESKPWVRAPDCLLDSGGVPLKGWVLKRATRGFAAHARAEGLRYTKKFGGLYALNPRAGFPQRMQRWLHELPGGTLMMCHPGHQTVDRSDPIAGARYEEYRYLMNRGLSDDCAAAGVSLVRFAELEPAG